eukprot:10062505-Lingulodinium_polyedra.AAC.1
MGCRKDALRSLQWANVDRLHKRLRRGLVAPGRILWADCTTGSIVEWLRNEFQCGLTAQGAS